MWEAGADRVAASVAWIAAALSAQLILRPPTLTAYEVDHLSAVRVLAPECMVLLRSDGAFSPAQPGEIALFGSGARTWPGRSGPAPPAGRQSPPWCRSCPASATPTPCPAWSSWPATTRTPPRRPAAENQVHVGWHPPRLLWLWGECQSAR